MGHGSSLQQVPSVRCPGGYEGEPSIDFSIARERERDKERKTERERERERDKERGRERKGLRSEASFHVAKRAGSVERGAGLFPRQGKMPLVKQSSCPLTSLGFRV